MDDTLYNLCDWAEIETIVYSEHDNPHEILGPHVTEKGILFNTFVPTAKSIVLRLNKTGKEYKMEKVDDSGFFSVLVKGKRIPSYTYLIVYDNDFMDEVNDPYQFEPVIDGMDLKLFTSGIHCDIYNKLGAHPMKINDISGTLFAVWAPNAMRVSVVGDFNLWDGRRHQMRRLGDSGVFELFIPGLQCGELYKYEIKVNSQTVMLKADPYAYSAEMRPATASIVYDIDKYQWKDNEWVTKREKFDYKKNPMLIYEVHLGSFMKPESETEDFYNYRDLALMIASYVKEMGYTHVELMPIMEHPLDASWGYQVTGYYAATARYGTPDDLMYFIDYMHQNNIGVIIDWVPAHFPKDAFGLANFDGTCLYEHLDPRQGSHPHWGTLIYNYGRPEVANFLIANAMFWAEKYHIDGIRMDAVASMLYLDYGKQGGEWIPNIYGGNENLEAIEFLHNLSNVFSKNKGVMLIAEESTAWEKVTGAVKDGGLGFDLKWNMGWMNDFIDYMQCDPLFRKGKHNELTFSMIYAYSENFILVLSHDEVVHGKGSMINKMPGSYDQKFANLRVAYGFMMTHPGKKLLFMGQDIAQFDEWNEKEAIQWNLLDYENHKSMKQYVKALNRLYKDYPALYELDYNSEGFEWINNMDVDRSVISFLRRTDREEETLLVVCNFTPVVYENYRVGVPFKGKYKETFNSDKEIFGGKGRVNPRLKYSKDVECDERPNSITITVPPLGISVFTCVPIKVQDDEKNSNKSTMSSKNTSSTKISTKNGKASSKSVISKAKKALEESKTKGITKANELKESAKKVKDSAKKAISKKAEDLLTKEALDTLAANRVEDKIAEELATEEIAISLDEMVATVLEEKEFQIEETSLEENVIKDKSVNDNKLKNEKVNNEKEKVNRNKKHEVRSKK